MSDNELVQKLLGRLTVDDTTGCWEWGGATTKGGYGHMRVGDKHPRTHRLAYELLVGPIPDGLEVDHLCGNRLCANPAHLEPVTRTENLRRTKAHLKQDHHVNESAFDSDAYLEAYLYLTNQ
jgi:hypothetical protein